MQNFDPNGAATEDSGIFGFPFSKEESSLVILPIPWEATCSYGKGAALAPSYIFEASMYVELFDKEYGNFYENGIFYEAENTNILDLSNNTSKLASPIIEKAGEISGDTKLEKSVRLINDNCKLMLDFVFERTKILLTEGKKIGIIGGDHSISQGAIAAHLEKYPDMGVLQIDAHADLRLDFEGLHYSHASVMRNVMEETKLNNLVQVGVRGYCEEEFEYIKNSQGKITTFFNSDIQNRIFANESWESICLDIVSKLPQSVYISFDIDGLEQSCCPNSGTPVPGGLTYDQALYLLKSISKSGKEIIGFDLVEVSCGKEKAQSWDAICAANLLYKICGNCLFNN